MRRLPTTFYVSILLLSIAAGMAAAATVRRPPSGGGFAPAARECPAEQSCPAVMRECPGDSGWREPSLVARHSPSVGTAIATDVF